MMYYVYDKTQELIINQTDDIGTALGFIENTEQIDLANDVFEPNNYIILTEYKGGM